MEVWYVIGIAYLYGRMLLLGFIALVGLGLCLRRSTRWLGAALALPTGLYGGWILLTPERLALMSQPPLVSTKLLDPPKPFPTSLIFHDNYGYKPSEETLKRETLDALVLAETGLFRVFLAGMSENDPILGEAVLKASMDCAKSRSTIQDFGQNGPKIGGLSFTARTGFAQCAELSISPVTAPPDRLDLWISAPSGDPSSANFSDSAGEMTLRATEGGTQRLIGTRQAHARYVPDALSRLGAYERDPRPEHSEIGVYATYDPDPVGFVLEALHVDPASLPAQGIVPDDDLSARAGEIVGSVSDSVGKLRVAVALIGAMRGGQDVIAGIEGRLAPTLLSGPPNPRLIVRVPSDCSVATRVAAGRAALAPVCTRASAAGSTSCMMPFAREEFLERCTTGFRDTIWDRAPKGRPTLILGRNGEASGIGIGRADRRRSAVLNRITVQPAAGLIDLVLVSSDPTIWSFEGALGCVDRVTIVGDGQGVVGIGSTSIQFRNRRGATHVENDRPGRYLADLLGQPAEQVRSIEPRVASFVIGDRGPAGVACQSTVVSPPIAVPLSPEQVVSRLDEVAFKLP